MRRFSNRSLIMKLFAVLIFFIIFFLLFLAWIVCFTHWRNVEFLCCESFTPMLSFSRVAAKRISTRISSRSYGKIRELTATVPNKMPKVCSSEEVVESIKSGNHVIRWI